MKNTIIRVFVLSLSVAGFGAATIASHARTVNTAKVAPAQMLPGSAPLCPPSTGQVCGMD
jgi:hypothetical protein